MEMFFILAVVIFVPFVWFIVRMLRFTDKTVGDDLLVYGLGSLENRTRTYQFSTADYFGTFDKVSLFLTAFIMMPLCSYILVRSPIPQGHLYALIFWLFILTTVAFASYIAFFFYFDWKFWTITQNVCVTFDPYTPSITVEEPNEVDVLIPDTISHIEHHQLKISNPRNPLSGYGCLCFHKMDGQLIWLNALFFKSFSQQSFLERFFPSVPVTIVQHKFPYTSIIDQVENEQPAEL